MLRILLALAGGLLLGPAGASAQYFGLRAPDSRFQATMTPDVGNCRGPHRVTVEGAPWVSPTAGAVFDPAGSILDMSVDLTGLAPGTYEGRLVLACLDCDPPCPPRVTDISVDVAYPTTFGAHPDDGQFGGLVAGNPVPIEELIPAVVGAMKQSAYGQSAGGAAILETLEDHYLENDLSDVTIVPTIDRATTNGSFSEQTPPIDGQAPRPGAASHVREAAFGAGSYAPSLNIYSEEIYLGVDLSTNGISRARKNPGDYYVFTLDGQLGVVLKADLVHNLANEGLHAYRRGVFGAGGISLEEELDSTRSGNAAAAALGLPQARTTPGQAYGGGAVRDPSYVPLFPPPPPEVAGAAPPRNETRGEAEAGAPSAAETDPPDTESDVVAAGRRYETVVDPLDGPAPRSIADELAERDGEDESPPEPRGAPEGFRHVTQGANPSSNTPISNHRAEGPDASSRIEDFFAEGRPVPHREGEPPFDSVHITRGHSTTQFAPRERHVTTGPNATGLSDGNDNPQPDPIPDWEEEPSELTDAERRSLVLLASLMVGQVQNGYWAEYWQRMLLDAFLLRAWAGAQAPLESRFVPVSGGPAPAEPFLYIEATGVSTGPAFRMFEIGGRVRLPELGVPGVVLEPVELPEEARRQVRQATRGLTGTEVDGYCLEFLKQVPPEGMAFRVADLETQSAAAPMGRILAAGRELLDAGGLRPDSDPQAYFHSIRQWALWTAERGFDRSGFEDAFVDHTRRNFDQAGRDWTPEIERAVRGLADNRWADIGRILERAVR